MAKSRAARKRKSLEAVAGILTAYPDKVGQVTTSTLQQKIGVGTSASDMTAKKELGRRAATGDYEQAHTFRTKRKKSNG